MALVAPALGIPVLKLVTNRVKLCKDSPLWIARHLVVATHARVRRKQFLPRRNYQLVRCTCGGGGGTELTRHIAVPAGTTDEQRSADRQRRLDEDLSGAKRENHRLLCLREVPGLDTHRHRKFGQKRVDNCA